MQNEVQRLIRRDQNNWLENECNALDQYDRTGKARQLFEKVRKLKKTPFKAKQACINDAQGNIITEQEPGLERWREYIEQLFAKPLNETAFAIQDYNVSEPVPLYREVSHAILHLKRRKVPGVDVIPADLIRASRLNAVEALYRLTVKICRDCSWPDIWKIQEIVLLHKGGRPKDCPNYRTIALISHASKILLVILLNRIRRILKMNCLMNKLGSDVDEAQLT